MTTRKLMKDKKTKYLVDENLLLGHIAMWAVRQSPYICPDNLREVLLAIKDDRIDAMFHDGAECLRMRKFTFVGLEAWLGHLIEIAYKAGWNTPKKDTGRIGSCSEGPDFDFIDLDALVRNIATSVINEIVLNG